jgi:hypothetical protein
MLEIPGKIWEWIPIVEDSEVAPGLLELRDGLFHFHGSERSFSLIF